MPPDRGIRLADAHGAAEIRAVPVDDRAEIEHDDVTFFGGRRARGVRRALSLAEPGEDVRRERGHARAVKPHQVLDLLDEIEHRHAVTHRRRDRPHRRVDHFASALHHGDLLGRLRAPEPVHEWRAGDHRVGRDGTREVEQGLGPRPVADRERRRRPEAARRSVEQGRPVVALADDDQLARQLTGHVEQRHHPRQDENGLPLGPEERSRDPAVRVLRLAERRDHALDAREVLEIGRRREEEEIDPGPAHLLGEPAPPVRVVEHAPSLERRQPRRSGRTRRPSGSTPQGRGGAGTQPGPSASLIRLTHSPA